MMKSACWASLVLALAISHAEAAKKNRAPETVTVVLSDFAFRPAGIVLHHGRAYRLQLVNRGSGGHNFSAPGFFGAADVDPADRAAIRKGGVELAKGETRTLRLTPAKGRYDLTCSHFLHAGFGMTGSITVD